MVPQETRIAKSLSFFPQCPTLGCASAFCQTRAFAGYSLEPPIGMMWRLHEMWKLGLLDMVERLRNGEMHSPIENGLTMMKFLLVIAT